MGCSRPSKAACWVTLLLFQILLTTGFGQTPKLRPLEPKKPPGIKVTPQTIIARQLPMSDLERRRHQFTVEHERSRFCSDEISRFSPAEHQAAAYVNSTLRDYFERHRNSVGFGPTLPFYAAKREIETNELFHFLRRMPKGALLHAHLSAVGRMDWVISQALATPNCYVRWPADPRNRGKLKIIAPGENKQDFVLVSEKMAEFSARGESFSNALRAALTLDADNAGTERQIWREFDSLFDRTGDFISHPSLFTHYLLDAFQTLWDDKVYYVELRDSLGGWDSASSEAVERRIQQIKAARRMMQARHSQFDCRIIVAGYRGDSDNVINKYNQARRLQMQHPDLIAGFDLIGEESGQGLPIGKANRTALNQFSDLQSYFATNVPTVSLPFYLHDGESAWADNDNLFDAILFRTPRIGHAFNLFRYPSLITLVKSNNVALEICPISNQLLGLTPDLRTHPAAGYLNAGIQCTLSSDDPLYFGNDGLSYDFWVALTAWNLDLGALKKLARNSITHSTLGASSKAIVMNHWETEWNKFITQFVTDIQKSTERSVSIR